MLCEGIKAAYDYYTYKKEQLLKTEEDIALQEVGEIIP